MKSILSAVLFFVLGSICLLHGSGDYNFFMISDTHFGAAGTYCTDPKAPRKHRTRKNIHRADRAMPHYRNLFKQIAKTADANTRFIVEGGDLIEGCTHNETVHKQVLTDAVNLMKEYFKFPIYMVKGNHEAAGNGGENAYKAVLLPEMAKYAKVNKLEDANYVIRQGRDVYVFLDYTSRNWFSFLEKTLLSLKEKPRWVFAVTHCPLLPTWAFRNYALRTIELLSQYDGILLCGHRHANTVTRYEKEGKRVTQITVTTILQPVKPIRMRMREVKGTLEQFKADFRKRASAKYGWFLPIFEEKWAPYLTEYRRFSGLGYARFYVSDKEVVMEYRGADLRSCVKVQVMTSRKQNSLKKMKLTNKKIKTGVKKK